MLLIQSPILHPGDILLNLIVTVLAPMFLCVTAGDVNSARIAAVETVNAYCARNRADLIAIAQIIACGLAALGSLSLSMTGEIPLSMTLRLRGNAVVLNQSAEQNRRAAMETLKTGDPMPYLAATAPTLETPNSETLPACADEPDPIQFDAFLNAATAKVLAAEAAPGLLAPAQNADQTPTQTTPSTVRELTEKRHQKM